MENLTRINDNEYLATDPLTGGTWRVVSPRLSREGARAAIARQIEDTGARPARGTTATIHFHLRMGEERARPDQIA
jgi:hypothetical protein